MKMVRKSPTSKGITGFSKNLKTCTASDEEGRAPPRLIDDTFKQILPLFIRMEPIKNHQRRIAIPRLGHNDPSIADDIVIQVFALGEERPRHWGLANLTGTAQ